MFVFIFLIVSVYSIQDYRQLVDYHEQINTVKNIQKYSKNINDEHCDQDLALFQQALENNELWAVRFVDTWAKVQAGYLSGNTFNFGDFDSCLTTKIDQSGISGKYCMIKYRSDDAISVPPSEKQFNLKIYDSGK